MKAIMISGRTLAQGASCESKMSLEYMKAVSVCHLSVENFNSLGLSEGKNILIKNKFGQIVLSARSDPSIPIGVVFIPMGPWANVLVGSNTGGCGTPQFKGVEVEIVPTDSPVLDITELFHGLKRKGHD